MSPLTANIRKLYHRRQRKIVHWEEHWTEKSDDRVGHHFGSRGREFEQSSKVQMPGACPGAGGVREMLKFRVHRRITVSNSPLVFRWDFVNPEKILYLYCLNTKFPHIRFRWIIYISSFHRFIWDRCELVTRSCRGTKQLYTPIPLSTCIW